jgi:hypothetical protein
MLPILCVMSLKRFALRATVLTAVLLAGMAVGAHAHSARAEQIGLMQGWYSYDYQSGIGPGRNDNVFFRTRPADDGSVWASDNRWSIDTPEDPDSVLALLRYQKWDFAEDLATTSGDDPIDLRGKCVSFDLKADNLDLKGGHATFWAMSWTAVQRWHANAPIAIGTDTWAHNVVRINDVDWHRSWAGNPAREHLGLDDVLRSTVSYGIGFVGFDAEPTGRIGLRNFDIADC